MVPDMQKIPKHNMQGIVGTACQKLSNVVDHVRSNMHACRAIKLIASQLNVNFEKLADHY
jgi:hypothetical protein